MTTSRRRPRQRLLVGAVAAAALGSVVVGPADAASTAPTAPGAATSASEPPGSRVPTPAVGRGRGAREISTRVLHFVDRGRRDPWRPSSGDRELMVTMTYPSTGPGRGPARYVTRAESRAFLAQQGGLPPATDRSLLARVRVPATRAAAPQPGRHPLVVLSPGFSLPRSALTGLAVDLASRGYVVANVDHTFESFGTSLPGGRLARCVACDITHYSIVPGRRALDLSFVLDRLLAPGSRWAEIVDPSRIGVAGHSIGGNAAATAMARDERFAAGVNLDGTFFDPIIEDVDRPFMLLGTQELHTPRGDDRTWRAAWRHLTGPRTWLTVRDSVHFSFVDYPHLIDQLGLAVSSDLPGRRALAITRAYVGSFFDEHLRGRRSTLLEGSSGHLPEVVHHGPSARS